MLYLTRNFFNPRTFIRFFQINKKIFIRNPKILNILKYPSKSALGKVEGQKEQNRSAFRKKSGKFIDYTRTFAEKSVVLKKNICTVQKLMQN